MILHKLLVHDKHMVARCDFWLYGRLAVQSPMTNICQVSKTMRDEAYQIFYSTNTFRFSSPCYLTSVLKAPQIQSTLSYVVLHIGKDATENGKCFSQLQKCENLKSLRITLESKLHARNTRIFHGILPFRKPLPKLQVLEVTIRSYLRFQLECPEEYVHTIRGRFKDLLIVVIPL
jgi:hypothetical protein